MDKELSDLVERVRTQAGLQLYAHAFGRRDLNDTREEWLNYVRGVKNLKSNPKFGEVFLYYTTAYITGYERENLGKAVVSTGLLLTWEFARGEYKTLDAKKDIANLSDVVTTDQDAKAHFIRLTINSDILDGGGRGCGLPFVTIVADGVLKVEVWNYLMNNPGKYMEFVRGLLPVSEFPNINRGILDVAQPLREIWYNQHQYRGKEGIGTKQWVARFE